jgi:hypothetical protein
MSSWWPIAALAVLRVASSALALYGLGRLVMGAAGALRGSACPRAPFARAFTFSSVGVAMFVTLQAMTATGGRTILCCMLAAFVGLLAFPDVETASQEGRPPPARGPGPRLAAALGLVVLGLWAGIHLFRSGPFPYQLHAALADASYWAAAARALPATHLESGAGFEAMLDPAEFSPEPYHFVELWLTAGLSRLWSVPPYGVLLFDVPVILGLIWLLGLMAIGENLRVDRWRALLCGLGVVAFAPFVAVNPVAHWLSGWDVLVFEGPLLGRLSAGRLLPGYIVVAAAAVLSLNRRPRRALAILALAPVMNPTLLALPFGGIVFFLLMARGEYAAPRRFLRVVLPCAVILAMFWSFYAIHSRMLPPDLLPYLLDPGLLMTKVHIVGKSVLHVAFVYGPYIAPALLGGAGLVRRSALAAAVMSATGLLGWVATHPFLDSHQFFVNTAIVVWNSVFVFAVLVTRPGVCRALMVTLVAVSGALRWYQAAKETGRPLSHDVEYLQSLEHLPSNLSGAFVVPNEVLASGNPHTLYLRTNVVPYLEPLGHFRGAVAMVDVLPVAPWPAMRYRFEDLLFRRFLSRYGIPSEPHVSACLQEAFVDHYDLDFVVLLGSAPEPLWLQARDRQRLTDRVSGDRFVLLDKTRKGRPPQECPYAAAPSGAEAPAR